MVRVNIEPIGQVDGGRTDLRDDGWGDVEATIVLDGELLGADATLCLDEFSHLEVVYLFHLVDDGDVTRGARRPRGNPEWPEVGILAQRYLRGLVARQAGQDVFGLPGQLQRHGGQHVDQHHRRARECHDRTHDRKRGSPRGPGGAHPDACGERDGQHLGRSPAHLDGPGDYCTRADCYARGPALTGRRRFSNFKPPEQSGGFVLRSQALIASRMRVAAWKST